MKKFLVWQPPWRLRRDEKPIVPFVLVGLGLLIMYERGTFELLRSLFT